jgi:hypothetical protein
MPTTRSRSRRSRVAPSGCIQPRSFTERPDVKQVVIVVSPEDREAFVEKFGASLAFMG